MCTPNANYPLFRKKHGLCFFQTINQYKQHPEVTRKGRKSRRAGFVWEGGLLADS
jgi:hypothetical protein